MFTQDIPRVMWTDYFIVKDKEILGYSCKDAYFTEWSI